MRNAFAIALAVVVPILAHAEPGAVDWQKKVVKCTGSGAANLRDAQGNPAVARIGAEKAAKLDAVRQCMETIKGVTIEKGETGGGELDVEVPMEGVLSETLIPKAEGDAKAPPATGEAAGTCLVIDARGRKGVKALAPR